MIIKNEILNLTLKPIYIFSKQESFKIDDPDIEAYEFNDTIKLSYITEPMIEKGFIYRTIYIREEDKRPYRQVCNLIDNSINNVQLDYKELYSIGFYDLLSDDEKQSIIVDSLKDRLTDDGIKAFINFRNGNKQQREATIYFLSYNSLTNKINLSTLLNNHLKKYKKTISDNNKEMKDVYNILSSKAKILNVGLEFFENDDVIKVIDEMIETFGMFEESKQKMLDSYPACNDNLKKYLLSSDGSIEDLIYTFYMYSCLMLDNEDYKKAKTRCKELLSYIETSCDNEGKPINYYINVLCSYIFQENNIVGYSIGNDILKEKTNEIINGFFTPLNIKIIKDIETINELENKRIKIEQLKIDIKEIDSKIRRSNDDGEINALSKRLDILEKEKKEIEKDISQFIRYDLSDFKPDYIPSKSKISVLYNQYLSKEINKVFYVKSNKSNIKIESYGSQNEMVKVYELDNPKRYISFDKVSFLQYEHSDTLPSLITLINTKLTNAKDVYVVLTYDDIMQVYKSSNSDYKGKRKICNNDLLVLKNMVVVVENDNNKYIEFKMIVTSDVNKFERNQITLEISKKYIDVYNKYSSYIEQSYNLIGSNKLSTELNRKLTIGLLTSKSKNKYSNSYSATYEDIVKHTSLEENTTNNKDKNHIINKKIKESTNELNVINKPLGRIIENDINHKKVKIVDNSNKPYKHKKKPKIKKNPKAKD